MNRRTFFAAVVSLALARPKRVGLTEWCYGLNPPPFRWMKVTPASRNRALLNLLRLHGRVNLR